jgi:hypothetical protein
MNAGDAELKIIEEAIRDFVPRKATGRFKNVSPWKEQVLLLRQRKASFRVIEQIFRKANIRTCKSTLAEFCCHLSGDTAKLKRRKTSHPPTPRATGPIANEGESHHEQEVNASAAATKLSIVEVLRQRREFKGGQLRTRRSGPRIARSGEF